MKADLKQAFETEMATAYGLFRNGSLDEAFVHLGHAEFSRECRYLHPGSIELL